MKTTKLKRGRPKGDKTKVKRIFEAVEPDVDKLNERHRKKLIKAVNKFSAIDVPKSKRAI